jgi:hypothetical protein
MRAVDSSTALSVECIVSLDARDEACEQFLWCLWLEPLRTGVVDPHDRNVTFRVGRSR